MYSEEKKFGFVITILSLAINIYIYISNDYLIFYGIIFTAIILVLAIYLPRVFKMPLLLWIKFGELINKFLSPIIIGFLYFLIITPVGLILKLLKIDLLKKDTIHKNTYWEHRKHKIGLMKDQF